MVGLTPKQKEELNMAIHEYMLKNNFVASAQNFQEEAGLDTSTSASTFKDILEKKWTSLVKLKRQVMDLEKQTKLYQEQSLCERCGAGNKGQGGQGGWAPPSLDGLPR